MAVRLSHNWSKRCDIVERNCTGCLLVSLVLLKTCWRAFNPTAFLLQVYYVYGFMLLVFLILAIVTVCVTIVGTYFLLNAENYHWQWTSFISAASTAGYVLLYSIYYYFMKTKMTGFFQTCFYFGYTLMFCLGLGILCGKSPIPSTQENGLNVNQFLLVFHTSAFLPSLFVLLRYVIPQHGQQLV